MEEDGKFSDFFLPTFFRLRFFPTSQVRFSASTSQSSYFPPTSQVGFKSDFTGDIDILINPSEDNAKRVLKALTEFGFGSLDLKMDDFTTTANVIQLGYAPVSIDILTSISGLTFEEVDKGKEEGMYGDVAVYFIGKNEYIRNKRKIGRFKDLADLESLGIDFEN